jgi:P4 family phage/plasmid primase-like protien
MTLNIAAAAAAGFPPPLLIPVAPPTASGMPPTAVGKAPAVIRPDGSWKGLGAWNHGTSASVREQCDAAGANCGLILGLQNNGEQFLAIDCDMAVGEDGDLSTKVAMEVRSVIIKAVTAAVGRPVWVRNTRVGRAAILLRLPPEQPAGSKSIIHLAHAVHGDLGRIELLAKNQQIVIAGQHPVTLRNAEWFRTDAPDTKFLVPKVDAAIPRLKDRKAVDDLLEMILVALERVRVTSSRTKVQDADRPFNSTQVIAEDRAPPSAAILISTLQAMPNPAWAGRDLYASVMHAVAGCIRAGKSLNRITVEDEKAIIHEAAKWAARWEGPNPSSVEVEAAKLRSDWLRREIIFAGWPTLMNTATDLGVLDIGNRIAVDEFEAYEEAPPVKEMHHKTEVAAPSTGHSPNEANGYLPEELLDYIHRPQMQDPLSLEVKMADTYLAGLVKRSIGGMAAYLLDEKRWIVWQGEDMAWSSRLAEKIVRQWIQTVLQNHASRLNAPETVLQKILSKARIEAVEKLVRFQLGLNLSDRTNRYMLQTPGGAYDLRTGEKVSGVIQRDMYEMRCTSVAPADVPTPNFDEVISLMCGRDEEIIAWVLAYLGYLALGNPVAHKLLVVHGPGGNGKGAFLRAIEKTMGTYAIEANRDIALESARNNHKTSLYDLKGKRFWFISEISPNEKWNEAQIKSLVGGDQIQANKMHRDMTYFAAEGAPIIACNSLPAFHKVDDALIRRFIVLSARLKPEKRDLMIEQRIVENGELSGILFKIMRHAKAIYENGFELPVLPMAMNRETNNYFDEQDRFFAWYRNETESVPSGTFGVPVTDMKLRFDEYICRHVVRGDGDEASPDELPDIMSMREFVGQLKKNGCFIQTDVGPNGQRRSIVVGVKLKEGLRPTAAEFEVMA